MPSLGRQEHGQMIGMIDALFDRWEELDEFMVPPNDRFVVAINKVNRRHLDSGDPGDVEDYLRRLLEVAGKIRPIGDRRSTVPAVEEAQLAYHAWEHAVRTAGAAELSALYVMDLKPRGSELALEALRVGVAGVALVASYSAAELRKLFFGK